MVHKNLPGRAFGINSPVKLGVFRLKIVDVWFVKDIAGEYNRAYEKTADAHALHTAFSVGIYFSQCIGFAG